MTLRWTQSWSWHRSDIEKSWMMINRVEGFLGRKKLDICQVVPNCFRIPNPKFNLLLWLFNLLQGLSKLWLYDISVKKKNSKRVLNLCQGHFGGLKQWFTNFNFEFFFRLTGLYQSAISKLSMFNMIKVLYMNVILKMARKEGVKKFCTRCQK